MTRETDSLRPSGASQSVDSSHFPDGLEPILNDIRQMIESGNRGLSCSIYLSRAGNQEWDGAEGELTCPLISTQGETLGWIAIRYPEGQSEAAGDRDLLRSASHLAASAIEQRMSVRLDGLTGLLTRSHFTSRASAGSAFAFLSIDLDRFQPINDSFGRETGDRVLQLASERLKNLLSESDFAGRLDGVEFAVALTSENAEPGALHTAETFLDALRAPYHIDGVELFVTASIGIAMNHGGRNPEELLRDANVAMHAAKRSGGNTLVIFRPENHNRSVERLRLEHALHRAIENAELDLLFQPIVDVQRKLEGFETLITWRHPGFGVVPPAVFIPIAEENGFIVELGLWVMREACRRGARWREAWPSGTRLSVNVSAREFEQEGFEQALAAALSRSGFLPENLELELTESCIVRDLPRSAQRMAAMRELGFSIAIDDFGTGYSSLSYLSKLPVDTLKLDQSFVRDIAEGASLPVIQGIVRLAHSMNLTVVAEGVETLDQFDLIRLVGCDRAQGSFCGPSLHAHEVERLLARELSASR